jgi:hypothetical protein
LASRDHAQLKTFLSLEKEWFQSWRPPSEAIERLGSITNSIRSNFPFQRSAFVTHREAKGLREMWVLAKCADLMGVSEIKLNAEDPPDGYGKREGEEFPAEVLEVIEPGRKRNLEFGPNSPGISMDPGENWVRRANAIPGALEAEIGKKKTKAYPQKTELFVYLNIDEYGIRQEEIEAIIRLTIAKPIAPFAAIHVRWKGKIYSNCGVIFVDRNAPQDPEFDDESLWQSIVSEVDD